MAVPQGRVEVGRDDIFLGQNGRQTALKGRKGECQGSAHTLKDLSTMVENYDASGLLRLIGPARDTRVDSSPATAVGAAAFAHASQS